MAYEDSRKGTPRSHGVILEDRKKLSVSGVEDVESYDDSQIVMRTVCGDVVIRGSDLSIDRLSLETGDVGVTGLITEFCYEEVAPSGSLWNRLFH